MHLIQMISLAGLGIQQRGAVSLLVMLLAIFAGTVPVCAQQEILPVAKTDPNAPDPIMAMVDEAIEVTKHRHLDFQQHTPWQILHGLLALRNDYVLKNGDEMVRAIDFISTEATYKGERWFEVTPHGGRAHPYNGTPYDFEGHVNQTMAIISMCDLPLDYPFHVDGQTITMADMVRHAQMTVNTREETTWTLWFLTHYLDQDTEWVNAAGQRWSMEYLVKLNVAANTPKGPCGGCHGLFALAYARNSYQKKHGRLSGAWLEADQKLQQYIQAARMLQNRDGSFSTEFFKARGYSTDFNERIKSSGHMIEWLMLALPDQRLNENWVRAGVYCLARDLVRNANQSAECGPLYHALHALILYKHRIQPTSSPTAPSQLVQSPQLKKAAGPVTLAAPDDESMPTPPEKLAQTNPPIEPEQPSDNRELQAPKLSTSPKPQSAVSEEAPRPPLRIAEDQEGVKKLSGTIEVDADGLPPNVALPEVLAPVPGTMPIFVAPHGQVEARD